MIFMAINLNTKEEGKKKTFITSEGVGLLRYGKSVSSAHAHTLHKHTAHGGQHMLTPGTPDGLSTLLVTVVESLCIQAFLLTWVWG